VGTARLTVVAQDAATRRPLASGPVTAGVAAGEYRAHLNRTIPAGRPLRICLNQVLNTFSVLGFQARPAPEFSLALLSNRGSLLGALPTAFSRASLWRPSWVGSWTFWVLAIALLATFGMGVAAVASAASSDEENGPDGDQNGDGEWPPSDSDRLPHASPSTAYR
jgi:hypothetical protein